MKKSIIFVCLFIFFLVQNVDALIPRVTFEKPQRSEIQDWERWDLIVVKFKEGTGIRLRNHGFISKNNADLTELNDLLFVYPDVKLARLFQRSETVYEMEKVLGEKQCGRQLADLNLYYAFGPSDKTQAQQLLNDLNTMDLVEIAYAEPRAELPTAPENNPLIPPSYVESQDYLESSPIGVDAYAGWEQPGGKGHNVKFVDVELAWVWSHQDLAEPFYQGGTQSPDQAYRDHGTAVMGEVASLENSFGTTGIAPLTTVGGQAIDIDDYPENVGSHFDLASAALDPGDIWLIELHAPGPDGNYIAMEYWQANYDAIANSTALGRICVEAAGNGAANFDSSIYDGRFDRNVRDSLAIIVGAGTPYDMEPEYFTCYGSRVDVNGWGSEIVTTGYGDRYSSEGENLWYTSDFGGTSGASPMVVGVCCVAQSIYKELTDGAIMSPEDLRAAITDTGAPQPEPVTQHIGPRPNIAALLEHPIFDVEGIFLDRDVYNCAATVNVTVRDPEATAPVTAQISTINEPTGETLSLTETEPGIFTGTIELTTDVSPTGDDMLTVDNGDQITAEYAPLSDTAMADADCFPAIISDITVTEVSDTWATITWQTNELSTSVLHYGEGTPNLTIADEELVSDHTMTITDLNECSLYVFSVESHDSGENVAMDDNGGQNYSFTTWEQVIFLEEMMDTDPGWTVSGGQWAFGQPLGQGGSHGSPDPTAGATGSFVYGYNLSGDYGNSLPEYHLTTTAIDLTEAVGTVLTFQRWLGVEQPAYDHAYVKVSNDGSTWHELWTNDSEIDDSDWVEIEMDISEYADGEPTVFIRWTMGTTDTAWVYCGWNIDDVTISCALPCVSPTPTQTPVPNCFHNGDVTIDGEITAADAQLAFMIALGSYEPTIQESCAADCNYDNFVTAGDAQQIFMVALGSGSCFEPVS